MDVLDPFGPYNAPTAMRPAACGTAAPTRLDGVMTALCWVPANQVNRTFNGGAMHRFAPARPFLLAACAVTFILAGCGGSSYMPPPVISVTVSPASATVQASASAPFTATVSNDSTHAGVNWAVSCAAAPCGSVSPSSTASGAATTYTAPANPAATLTVTLSATSVTDSSKSMSSTVTVPGPSSSIAVTISPATGTVQTGATAPFTANVTGDTANAGVTWSLSCLPAQSGEQAGDCGGLSAASTPSGSPTTYTAPTSGDLNVTITAASVTNPNAVASASVRVPGTAVVVSPGSATVALAGAAQFTATVFNDATNQGVTWSLVYVQNGSSVPCPSVDVCGSVSPTTTLTGVATTYTAPTAPPAGDLEVVLTATAVANSAASGQAFATIPGIAVSVAPGNIKVEAAATAAFTATVTNDPNNQGVTWTLSSSGTPCSPGCGTVSPATTANGSATTYTAPATPPSSDLIVILTAASITNSAATGSASITVPAITMSIAPAGVLLPLNLSAVLCYREQRPQ